MDFFFNKRDLSQFNDNTALDKIMTNHAKSRHLLILIAYNCYNLL